MGTSSVPGFAPPLRDLAKLAVGSIDVTSLAATAQTAVYTLTQWPPVLDQNQYAILADTYDSVAFSWALQYRPDLNGTYPWDGLDNGSYTIHGTEPTNNVSDNITSATYAAFNIGGTRTDYRIRIPRAGYYDFHCRFRMNSTGNADIGVGIDTTGSGTPTPGSVTSAGAGATSKSVSFSAVGPFAAGDYAQLMGRDTGLGLNVQMLSMSMRPSSIA